MKDITVEELKQKMDEGQDFILIDVRESYERDEFHIGGEWVPLGSLPAQIDDWDDWQEKEVIIYCRSGARSAAAKDFMVQNHFKNVRNLLGGILDWKAKFE